MTSTEIPDVYFVDMSGYVDRVDDYWVLGSGEPYAGRVLHSAYRDQMPTDRAALLVRSAIENAAQHDRCTGGVAEVFRIRSAPRLRELLIAEDISVERPPGVQHP